MFMDFPEDPPFWCCVCFVCIAWVCLLFVYVYRPVLFVFIGCGIIVFQVLDTWLGWSICRLMFFGGGQSHHSGLSMGRGVPDFGAILQPK